MCIRQSSVVTEPSAVKSRPRNKWGMWKCQTCKAWSSFLVVSVSVAEVCKEGQQLVPEHVNALTVAGSLWHATVNVLSVNDCGNRNSGVSEEQESAQEAPATVKRQSRGNLFGASDSCVPFFSVFVGLLTSVSSVYCLLWVRAERDSCTDYQF